jgi:cysteine synthase A
MIIGSLSQVIGETPLIKIESLSRLTGNNIYGKAEFLNPGGSIKDRTALGIINEAEKNGSLKLGDTIIEGTAGNTGIGLAIIAAQRGYKCIIVMPNNQSTEKYTVLKALGVELITVAPCPFSDQNHFYHTARRISEERKNCFWANQFENTANFRIHYSTTGKEIFSQLNGKVDAFVSSAGTGGSLAGISTYLKEKNPNTHIRLIDPFGSGLYEYVKNGKFSSTGSSMTEGIGIMRLTANFKEAKIDEAIQVKDQEMIDMLYFLAHQEGLLIGTSAALNVFGAYSYAKENKGKNLNIVTLLCDGALRYQNKVFNPEYLKAQNIEINENAIL